MEKAEAIKEWAFQEARTLPANCGLNVGIEKVIEDARKIEAYINSATVYPDKD